MNFQQARTFGERMLSKAGIADVAADAWLLLSFACGIDRTHYYMRMTEELSKEEWERYSGLLSRRGTRIPLQYLTGTQEFMGLSFAVSEHVLIPRMETELLVCEVLAVLREGMRVLDIGTGSGCIIVSLMKLAPGITGSACDLSRDALCVARENAAAHGVSVDFLESDLFSGVDGTYDVVISNPPYIPSGEIENLMPEVRGFEPRLALNGGTDGYDCYRRLAADAPAHLNDGGYLFMEIGHAQGAGVAELIKKAGFADVKVKKDLQGLDRIVTGRWREDKNV